MGKTAGPVKPCSIIIGFCVCVGCLPAKAGLFGEHKWIGDLSFIKFVHDLGLSSFFRDSLQFKQFGLELSIPFTKNIEVKAYYQGMFAIGDGQSNYSYGDLCGLSGDHSVDVLQLFEGLYSNGLFSDEPPSEKYKGLINKLSEVCTKQHDAIDHYKKETGYLYASYILLANEDRSHFQRPPLSMGQMLEAIDFQLINLLDSLQRIAYDPNNVNHELLIQLRVKIAKKFLHLNNTAKYAILHILALDCMNSAATDYCNGDNRPFIRLFKIALIFNAFADHFLQDAFAAGHIPVRRTIFGFDNKGVHDYYCRTGLNVHNQRGESWRTYGDGFYDSATYLHAIQADLISLKELWDYFNQVRSLILSGSDYPLSLFEKLADKETPVSGLACILMIQFKSYSYVPIPYDVDSYRDSIALKHGTKPGAYGDAGMFVLPGTAHSKLGFNGELSLLSFNMTYYDSNYNKTTVHLHPGRETKYWIGGGLAFDYSVISIGHSVIYTAAGAIDFTIWDRLLASLNVGIVHQTVSYFLLRPMIGYELKCLKSPVAPSIRAFYDISALRLTKYGILLSLRLY
jgi:hypothetical protein